MKNFLFVSSLFLALSAGTAMARDFGAGVPSLANARTSKPLDAHVEVPTSIAGGRDVRLPVELDLPAGCMTAVVDVEHRDFFTHVLRPRLVATDGPCVLAQAKARTVANLGRLPIGMHTFMVEGVERQQLPHLLWVAGDVLATH